MAERDSWNILERPWLSASTQSGAWRAVSPLELLRSPSDFRAISASSPLDEFAALRFLTTLVYWKADAGGGLTQVRSRLLSGGMPAEVVDAIAAERDNFNLFDPKRPFLQDPSAVVLEEKPVGEFFAEMATGTNIAHFDHSRDFKTEVCVPCVVRGLLRLVPWSQSGGRGRWKSIHGAPPVTVIRHGSSVAQTLSIALVNMPNPLGAPTWSGRFLPSNHRGGVALLEALTWNPRRVLLSAPSLSGRCALCGVAGPQIRTTRFVGNEALKVHERDDADDAVEGWADPAHIKQHGRSSPVSSRSERAASRGADLGALTEPGAYPRTADRAISLTLVVPTTDKAKTFDHRRVEVPAGTELSSVRVEHHGGDGLPLAEHPLELGQPWRGGADVRAAVERFVGAAAAALDETHWIALRRALGRTMHDEPEAFAIFSAVYWRVRSGGRATLRRDAAWILLKLLALAPSSGRSTRCDRRLAEVLDAIPTRQAHRTRSDADAKSPYPIAPSRGLRLENELTAAIEADLAAGRDIPWLELGTYLNHAAR